MFTVEVLNVYNSNFFSYLYIWYEITGNDSVKFFFI